SEVAALELMLTDPVDVVVSDFRMPGMSGGKLLTEVRRHYPDTARLILSGHTEEKDLTTVVSLAHQFLTKPCPPDELVLVVERALRLRRDLDGEGVRANISGIGMLPSPPSTLHEHARDTARLAWRRAAPDLRDDAFCAGLLHEIGQLVLASRPDMFVQLVCGREHEGRSLQDAELEVLGVTHAQAGAYLLSLWGFPLEIVEAVAHHGGRPDTASLDRSNVVAMVQLAHMLVESERSCVCGRRMDGRLDD